MNPTLMRADHEPTMWLRGRLVTVLTKHATRMFGQCGHLEKNDDYAGHVVLWDDECRMCPGCFPNYAAEGIENLRCDRCGRIDQDTAPFAVLAASHTTVHGGLCPSCGEREVGA